MRQSEEVVVKPEARNGKKRMKVRIPRSSGLTRFFLGPVGRTLLIATSLVLIGILTTFTYFYAKYARVIDDRLRAGVFANSAKIFAAPGSVAVGDAITAQEIATELRRSGYTESRGNPIGYYQTSGNAIEVFPGPDSYFDQEAGVIRFNGGKISQIVSLQDNTQRSQYQLEPQLIQAMSGVREKRRMVKFQDLPRVLVDAVTSIEDKRFFQHSGFDPLRIM
jgi:penicillin-binding protein 1B